MVEVATVLIAEIATNAATCAELTAVVAMVTAEIIAVAAVTGAVVTTEIFAVTAVIGAVVTTALAVVGVAASVLTTLESPISGSGSISWPRALDLERVLFGAGGIFRPFPIPTTYLENYP